MIEWIKRLTKQSAIFQVNNFIRFADDEMQIAECKKNSHFKLFTRLPNLIQGAQTYKAVGMVTPHNVTARLQKMLLGWNIK